MTASRSKKAKSTEAPQIPVFRSIEEEAAFWDTHDSADFSDQFEDVEDFEISKVTRLQSISVELDGPILDELKLRAKSENLTTAALARRWILEALGHESSR